MVPKIHTKIPVIIEQAYINSNHYVFFKFKGEGICPTKSIGRSCMIRVQISGCKVDDKENHSLVRKILTAKDTRRINCVDDDEYMHYIFNLCLV